MSDHKEPASRHPMFDHVASLGTLYATLEAIAGDRDSGADGWAAHAAILDRLASNRRDAESAGWTSCALERDGALGRLRIFGVPPGERLRTLMPDPPSPSGPVFR